MPQDRNAAGVEITAFHHEKKQTQQHEDSHTYYSREKIVGYPFAHVENCVKIRQKENIGYMKQDQTYCNRHAQFHDRGNRLLSDIQAVKPDYLSNPGNNQLFSGAPLTKKDK
jgi:hypothetical protein